MIISNFIAYAIQTWKNKPDTSTPLSAARLAHIEAGIKANSDAITKLAAAVINQQANDVNKIPSSALMYSVNEKVDSAISDLDNITSANTLLYTFKYLPPSFLDNPNSHFKVSGWTAVPYLSLSNTATGAGWGVILGIYDNNNGTPMGRQFVIGTSKCMERRYLNGTWQSWVDK